MEDRQRRGDGEEEGANPQRSPPPPPLKERRGRDCPQWASKNQGPSPGNPSKGTPGSASPPGLGEEGNKACRLPPCSLRCEHLPTRPGAPLCPLDPSPPPRACPAQGGAQVELGAGRGPGTFCSFLHHWLPGQECPQLWSRGCWNVCSEKRGHQGTWAEPWSPGIAGTEEAGGIWP